MQKQVLIRRPLRGGINELKRATVLSESDGQLRVMLDGAQQPVTVAAADVMPADQVFGTSIPGSAATVVPKTYR